MAHEDESKSRSHVEKESVDEGLPDEDEENMEESHR